MKLCILGVNHETAPVDIRETVSFSVAQIALAVDQLKQQSLAKESVILSTCNRTEVYCVVDHDNIQSLTDWLHQFFNLSMDSLSPYLYIRKEIAAVKHIMRVASGLDSLVLGEPQIFGQIKEAYNLAHKNQSIHQNLENLFQNIFKTVKQVRTDTAIGNSPISVAFSAVTLAKQFFGDINKQTALLLGAGETIQLVSRHLKESGVGNLIIANRTLSRAQDLANEVQGYAVELEHVEMHLHEADIIIGSTGSPNAILTKKLVKQALKKRKNRPIFMVDIAVPRDIDAKVGDLNNVYLYTVDDLQDIIEGNKQSRQSAAEEAEEIIENQAHHFVTQFEANQQIKPLIQRYRQQSMSIKEHALAHALHQLEQGVDEQEILKRLANQLTNRLIHTPTKQLHSAAMQGDKTRIQLAEDFLICPEAPQPDKFTDDKLS